MDYEHAAKSAEPLRLAFLPGDGIGPEITEASATVLTAALETVGVEWTRTDSLIGLTALEQTGSTFPEDAFSCAAAADGAILGPVSHLDYPEKSEGGLNPSGELRKRLSLFANVRPAKSIDGVPHPISRPIDLVIVRENTEGFYADRTMVEGTGEFKPTADLALSMRKVSRLGSTRIARHAFELATQRRSKVTVVHKANVLRITDGLFLECVREVARDFPQVEYEELLVDAMAAHLIRRADEFDVIVTTNMFGDILSDEATELAGGLGMAASVNVGKQHCVAQAQHGSAPSLAGKDVANPGSLIGSVGMLLNWLSVRRNDGRLHSAAQAIQNSLEYCALDPASRTTDIGGTATTSEVASAVAAHIAR